MLAAPFKRRNSMAYKVIILASAAILAAAPALSAPSPAVAADSGSGAAATASGGSSAAKPATPDNAKYCVEVEPPTGSRLNMTQCKTRAEWAKEGVDVDQLNKE
jgi:hypothetical protein